MSSLKIRRGSRKVLGFDHAVGGVRTGAQKLASDEREGLWLDFSDASVLVRSDSIAAQRVYGDVQAFWRDRSFTSYASPSPKITRGSDGLYGFRPHNLLGMSEKFDSAKWEKARATISADATTAPDGTTTADKLVEDSTATNTHYVTQSLATSAAVYAFSVYAKAGERTSINLWVDDTTSGEGVVYFNLSNGTVSATAGTKVASGSISDVGSGWYRCTIVTTAITADTHYFVVGLGNPVSYSGDGASGAYIWGAQLNAGASLLTYVKTAAHNLLLQSQTFDNASWTKNSCSAVSNATAAPDGTTTADTLTEDNSNGVHEAFQLSVTMAAVAYTWSAYIKPNGRTWIGLNAYDGSSHYSYFNCAGAGTIGTQDAGNTSSITAVGNGWYRIAVTRTASATANGGVAISLGEADADITYLGDSASGAYVWGAQIELASSPGKYVTTTASAVYETRYELPREWNSSGVCQGLLVEEARTNLCLRSEELDNASWTKSNTTVSANSTASPDGNTTADTVTASAGNTDHYMLQSITWTAAVYTVSVFAKLGTHRYWQLTTWDGTTSRYCSFDLQAGTVGTASNGTGTITSVGSGWYRLVFVSSAAHAAAAGNFAIAAADSTNPGAANPTWNAAGTETSIFWGVQVEAGAFATSYIPTTSASVTRAVDNITINSSLFPTSTSQTFYAKFKTVAGNAYPARIIGVQSNWTPLYFGSVNVTNWYNGTAEVSSPNSGDSTTGFIKAAACNDGANMSITRNGQAPTTAAQTLPAVTTLHIAEAANGPITGLVAQILYVPRRMTDGQLQAVTT